VENRGNPHGFSRGIGKYTNISETVSTVYRFYHAHGWKPWATSSALKFNPIEGMETEGSGKSSQWRNGRDILFGLSGLPSEGRLVFQPSEGR